MKPLRLLQIAGIISIVGERKLLKGYSIMVTHNDFGRSSWLMEQYQREMDIITAALCEESQDEQEERLSLVASSWSLTCSCFQAQLESSEAPAYVSASVVFARS
jgi:hypothetical protein